VCTQLATNERNADCSKTWQAFGLTGEDDDADVEVGGLQLDVQRSHANSAFHDINLLGRDAMSALQLQYFDHHGIGKGTVWFDKPSTQGCQILIDPAVAGKVSYVREIASHVVVTNERERSIVLEATPMQEL
jgi:hypothetical protein